MRRSNFQQMGQVIDDFFKKSGLLQKFKETELKENWNSIVGPLFAKSTKKIAIYNGVLFVTMDSPAIKNEIFLNRTKIIERLNSSVNQQIIHDIVVK
jgi:predicted nucleic acid-binding Zn ribbon protein